MIIGYAIETTRKNVSRIAEGLHAKTIRSVEDADDARDGIVIAQSFGTAGRTSALIKGASGVFYIATSRFYNKYFSL